MMNKDYVFHVNWEDRHKQLYKVGILAQLDEYFYLIIKDEQKASEAYRNGFIGIPGFKNEEVYRSRELFDFFKNRILGKNSTNPSEELALTGAKSMIDSYSVERVPEKVTKKYRQIILEAYQLQEKTRVQEEQIVNAVENKNNSEELPDLK